jgi:2-polyprenyl-3-methyl-5-hydroxy-6-metoxy-1,4-benzoquinol methylase
MRLEAAANLMNTHDRPEGYYQSERPDMLRYIPAGVRTTLEFGGGCGGFSALLKSRLGVESWAVEIEPRAAQEAARKLDKVICADAHASIPEIPDHHFDCIIFCDLLEHLADPYSLLLAVKPKLTATGVVVASIPNIRYYRAFLRFAIHGDWQYEDQGVMDRSHLRFFTHKSILDTFERLGYRILTLEGIHPTSSRTYKLLNGILLNALWDVRYKHFAVVAAP